MFDFPGAFSQDADGELVVRLTSRQEELIDSMVELAAQVSGNHNPSRVWKETIKELWLHLAYAQQRATSIDWEDENEELIRDITLQLYALSLETNVDKLKSRGRRPQPPLDESAPAHAPESAKPTQSESTPREAVEQPEQEEDLLDPLFSARMVATLLRNLLTRCGEVDSFEIPAEIVDKMRNLTLQLRGRKSASSVWSDVAKNLWVALDYLEKEASPEQKAAVDQELIKDLHMSLHVLYLKKRLEIKQKEFLPPHLQGFTMQSPSGTFGAKLKDSVVVAASELSPLARLERAHKEMHQQLQELSAEVSRLGALVSGRVSEAGAVQIPAAHPPQTGA